ncbi:restriction endonuclease subunit S [Candidatus Nitronereus thalassa]|uniref:Restriction endonuclease subunit S n=1 Tax=Candidatus Nitronereus thalassa TaxID=3020898 RepID=A0ABU3K8F8_9BACT|nr:restriction endonuclease subunit S [Candidatus Nitronereus thalassa]MDT7042676.1 restriction endonuclease subunit S [Candidatus Nitronereus thalassa]
MEVKPGYKRTEVGVIPDDWSFRFLASELDEMTDFVAAGSFEALRNNIRVYDTPNYALYVRLFDLRLGLGHSAQKYVDEFSYRFLSKSNLFGNEILVANIGANVGEAFQMPAGLGPATVAPNMIVLRPNERKIQPDYLFFYLTSDFGQARFGELIAGSGHPKINKTDLKKLKVVVPPLPEQEAIAEALSDADALIEFLEQLLAKKRHLKQGAMQELLPGKKRLPGFEVKPGYKQTEVGVIPEDWHPTTIGDLAIKVGSGITPKGGSSRYKEYGRPFVRSQNIGWGTLHLSGLAYIDDDTHNNFSATELRQDDVLLNITGASIGRSAIADARLAGGNVNQHVCIIRTDSGEIASSFINYFLLSSLGQQQIDSFQAGGNREGLNFGQIRSIKLPLPPTKSEQTAIATILTDMDAEIAALEAKLAKARQLKQGMMQKLLTGRIRLVQRDQEVSKKNAE